LVDPTGRAFTLAGFATLATAVSIRVSLLSEALPLIVFGIVRLGTTLVVVSALQPVLRARDEAFLLIGRGKDTHLEQTAIETILLAQEVIRIGYSLLQVGLSVIDEVQELTEIAIKVSEIKKSHSAAERVLQTLIAAMETAILILKRPLHEH